MNKKKMLTNFKFSTANLLILISELAKKIRDRNLLAKKSINYFI